MIMTVIHQRRTQLGKATVGQHDVGVCFLFPAHSSSQFLLIMITVILAEKLVVHYSNWLSHVGDVMPTLIPRMHCTFHNQVPFCQEVDGRKIIHSVCPVCGHIFK